MGGNYLSKQQHADVVIDFYDTHPISETQIIGKLEAEGIDLSEVNQDILQDHDQDHFGGFAANDALAKLAVIDQTSHVLDVCSGLGGPARYLAHNYGCEVTGIDLTASRVESATRLTEMAGLADLVRFQQGDATALPFADASFDVVTSQEAFCHVPGKGKLVAEIVRVLKPGGRVAFTDILATNNLSEATAKRLQSEMAFVELGTIDAYRRRFQDQGCTVTTQDLSEQWRDILVDRLAMYRSLKEPTIERFAATHFAKWDSAYSHFVGLYETGEMGGARFLVQR